VIKLNKLAHKKTKENYSNFAKNLIQQKTNHFFERKKHHVRLRRNFAVSLQPSGQSKNQSKLYALDGQMRTTLN
jgi:hypothetical protein